MEYTFRSRIATSWFKIKRLALLFIRRFQTQDILAVYDTDLDGVLEKLQLSDKIEKGFFKCPDCGCTITRDNLGLITNENDATLIYCIATSCSGTKKMEETENA